MMNLFSLTFRLCKENEILHVCMGEGLKTIKYINTLFTESAPRPSQSTICNVRIFVFMCVSVRAILKHPLPGVVETSGQRT